MFNIELIIIPYSNQCIVFVYILLIVIAFPELVSSVTEIMLLLSVYTRTKLSHGKRTQTPRSSQQPCLLCSLGNN